MKAVALLLSVVVSSLFVFCVIVIIVVVAVVVVVVGVVDQCFIVDGRDFRWCQNLSTIFERISR